jgi:uncharacterized tellurite resistance protein B-like protein
MMKSDKKLRSSRTSIKKVGKVAAKLCKSMPAHERVILLKDLWSIAASNGKIDLYEQKLFHRVAVLPRCCILVRGHFWKNASK